MQTRTSGAPCLLRRPFALPSPPDLLANPHLRCSLSASQTVCSFFSSGFTRKPAPPVLSVCFADCLLFLLLRIHSQTRTSGAPCLLHRPFALPSPPDSLANPHLRCFLSASQTVCSSFSSGFTRKPAPPVLPVCFADRLLVLLLRIYSQTRTSGAPCLLRRPFALPSPPDSLANPHLRCSLSASQTVCSLMTPEKQMLPSASLVFLWRHYIIPYCTL
mgnify:FL=1